MVLVSDLQKEVASGAPSFPLSGQRERLYLLHLQFRVPEPYCNIHQTLKCSFAIQMQPLRVSAGPRVRSRVRVAPLLMNPSFQTELWAAKFFPPQLELSVEHLPTADPSDFISHYPTFCSSHGDSRRREFHVPG
jgi:hypothetical protein